MSYDLAEVILELKSVSIDTPNRPKLPNELQLQEYEKKIGFKFPDCYKKFLMEASDVFVGTLNPLIVSETDDSPSDIAVALAEGRKLGLPNTWLPICEDNGDYYCLTSNEEVKYWSLDGDTGESWPNLETWIKEVWINEN